MNPETVWILYQSLWLTRMHSSRMRTGHSLIVCGGGGEGFPLPGGSPCPEGSPCLEGRGSPCWGQGGLAAWGDGGGSPCLKGFSLPRGVLLARGMVSLPGGSSCPGGFSLPGKVLPTGWGFSLLGGLSLLETPPVNRITHSCKNITLATTLLWPVINDYITDLRIFNK